MSEILGVKIDNITRKEAIARVEQMLKNGGQHIITTPNPEMLVDARKDQEFREALNRADLALPDGFGLMLAAHFLSTPLKERICGSDFVWDIFALAAENGYSVYFLGGKEGVAQAAAEGLRIKDKGLRIVGVDSGPQLIFKDSPLTQRTVLKNIQRIKDACPDIILVAFGHNKQEKWIARHLGELPSVKIAMGVGGVFDFISGRVRRAPRFMRKIGLEWLWRLGREPRRISRIWRAVVVFICLILREKRGK